MQVLFHSYSSDYFVSTVKVERYAEVLNVPWIIQVLLAWVEDLVDQCIFDILLALLC